MPQLTRKNDLICWVYLSEIQQRIYQDFIDTPEVKEVCLILQICCILFFFVFCANNLGLFQTVLLYIGFPRILESTWIFCLLNSRPWKYLKTGQVLESHWISFYRSSKVLEFTKLNYAISAMSLNKICIGLECIFFTYLQIILIGLQVCCHWAMSVDHKWKQKKLYCNHRNRY